MSGGYCFSPCDTVILVKQSHSNNPPVGTIGRIKRVYMADGGEAAIVDWECDTVKVNGHRVLMKCLEPYTPPEITESDESLDILFGGVAV